MVSWAYVIAGFGITAAGLGFYALCLHRRLARLRPGREGERRR